MRKYKLLTDNGYYEYIKGEVYSADHSSNKLGDLSVAQMTDKFPDDWAEVITDETLDQLEFSKDIWRRKQVYSDDGYSISIHIHKACVCIKTTCEEYIPIKDMIDTIKELSDMKPELDLDQNFALLPKHSVISIPYPVTLLPQLNNISLALTGKEL